MVIGKLSETQFKKLFISMLKDLFGYFHSIEKTQGEMKVTMSEIKKNPQGTNSGGDDAKNQINNLEHRA